MEELTLIEKFDAVLDALYDFSGKHPTFFRLRAILRARKKKIHWGELMDIMVKIEKDGLAHPKVQSKYKKRKNAEWVHLITFEGKLLKERGGLKNKVRKENWLKTRVTILEWATFIIALATLYNSLGGVNDNTLIKVNETLKERLLMPKPDTPLIVPVANNNINLYEDTLDSVHVKK